MFDEKVQQGGRGRCTTMSASATDATATRLQLSVLASPPPNLAPSIMTGNMENASCRCSIKIRISLQQDEFKFLTALSPNLQHTTSRRPVQKIARNSTSTCRPRCVMTRSSWHDGSATIEQTACCQLAGSTTKVSISD